MPKRVSYNLDDPEVYPQLDPSGLRKRLRDLPGHCQAAWQQAQTTPLPGDWADSDKVVIGGMGGSAIAGDLASDLAAARSRVPVLVVRDLIIPHFMSERTLFFACSYSGNTEETLSMWEQVGKTSARAAAISGGGALTANARRDSAPLLAIDVAMEPRSAVGYNLMLILGVLERLGLMALAEAEVGQTVRSIRQEISTLTEDVPTAENPAKQLAMELRDKLILVYGGGLFKGAARRWKSQFNENAKAWAYHEPIPEILHNSVEAFPTNFPMDGRAVALLLEPGGLDDGQRRRYEVVAGLLRRNGIPCHSLKAGRGPALSQLMNMLILGDYVSYYLALLRGIDPSPNPSIDEAKELLSMDPAMETRQ